jgi:hypothetical protein
MRKLLLATTILAATVLLAAASGWHSYYDCGQGVVAIIDGWHGKMWLNIDENGKSISTDDKIYDGGIDALDDNPKQFNTNFSRVRVKFHGKTVIFNFQDMDKVTFGGHSCRDMGVIYSDEVKQYTEDYKKWKEQH